MKMPTSNSGGARFRGPTSSADYNRNEDDKYVDLVELYRQNNINYQNLSETNQIILAENAALHRYVSMLERRLDALGISMDQIEASASSDPVFSKTGFVYDMQTTYPNLSQENGETSLRCDIDEEYRYATIPLIHQIPKTHTVHVETGKTVIPSELKVKVGRSGTKGEVVDHNLINCFNAENELYWQRTVTYGLAEAPDQEDVIMEIELPSHLVNNLNINTIHINPHPERGVQVKNVEVHYNSAWTTIQGFTQQDLSSVNTNEYAPRKRWFFPEIPVQKIRITLVQKNATDLNGKRVFILGAQEIGVHLSVFEASGGTVLTPFEMDGIYNIESIKHVFLNRNAFGIDQNLDQLMEGRVFEYELLREEADGFLTPLKSSEWSGQFAERLWVRSKLLMYNNVNPCLHAIELFYSR